jgi:uncharacterized protein
VRVLITGSSGLIGSALKPALVEAGHHYESLRRGPSWDPESSRLDPQAVEGFDAVVHLAGEGIGDHRWNERHKQRVKDSRVNGTGALARALAARAEKPAVLVSASAVGYYGNRGDEVLTEESGPGDDFLAEVCAGWEAATRPAEDAGIRVVHLRTGIVLSPRGGALGQALPFFRLGLGGRLGSGEQYWSWISLDDEVGAVLHALSDERLTGAVNATAPDPVTNAVFTKALGKALHRPTVFPVPRAALAVRFGKEMAEVMVLASQRALPAKLEATGYRFRHPSLDGALEAIL